MPRVINETKKSSNMERVPDKEEYMRCTKQQKFDSSNENISSRVQPSTSKISSEIQEKDSLPDVPEADSPSAPAQWTGQYAIVKAVFEILSIKDLLASSQCSKFWSQVGRVVRSKRRNTAQTILWHPYSEQGRTKEAVEYYNGFHISDEVEQMMTDIVPAYDDVHLGRYSMDMLKEWQVCFWRDFIQQFSESQLILMFATKSFSNFIQLRKRRFAFPTEVEAFFGRSIPSTVPCAGAFGCGVGMTLPNSTDVFEMERTELPMVTGLIIPKVSGLSVEIISFDKEIIAEKYKRRKSVNSTNCTEILGILPTETIKGLMILDADSYGRYTNPFIDAVFHYVKDHPTVCVAGGSVHFTSTSVSHEEMAKQLGFGIKICGNENVNVATIGMFDPGITDENEIKLKKFQKLISNGESSFAFMFACNGRGASMHNKEHAELTLFRKYYPKTPIIGIFTGGELVHECFPGESASPPASRKSLEFTFSTIFLFVSYKNSA